MAGFIFGFFLYQLINGWFFLGRTKINFGDLDYVVSCGNKNGLNWSYFSDNGCSGYMYGSLILRLVEVFGLNNQQVYIIGLLFFIGFSIIFSSLTISSHNPILSLMAGSIIIFSPPVELILQRANIDALIFILVYVSSELILRHKFGWALFLLSICSLMKFYTLPLLIAISLLYTVKQKKRIRSQFYLLFVLLICVIDINNVGYFPGDAQNFFGAPIFGEYLQYLIYGPNTHSNLFISGLLGILLYWIFCYFFYRISLILPIYPSMSNVFLNRKALILFSMNFLVFASCYLAGLNIDYRLVFIAVPILAFFNLKIEKSSWLKFPLLFVAFLVLYTSYNTYIFQPIGDFFILLLIAYFTVFFLKEISIIITALNITR